MIAWLRAHTPFPPVEAALQSPNGLLAASAEISTTRLLEAYRLGIFPWYSAGDPVLWWCPDPRMVLPTAQFRVRRSLRQHLRRVAADPAYDLLLDRDFAGVMRACAQPRVGQDGTWISAEMLHAYSGLAERGLAHSLELWRAGQLIGGLYGVGMGRMFFGESMFARESDASKTALAALVALLVREDVPMIDCQQRTAHLESLGGREVSRAAFCQHVQRSVDRDPVDWCGYRGGRLNRLLEVY